LTDARVIEANGLLSATDLAAAWRLHGAKANRNFLMIDLALVVVGLCGWAWWQTDLGMMLTAIGVVCLGLHLASSRLLLRRARRLFAQQKSLHGTKHYHFDAEGVQIRDDTGHAMRPWSYYRRWQEDHDVFVLYQSDLIMELMPKRWLAGADDGDALRERLRACIGPPNVTRSG
jgi:hypothetical protein